MKDTSSSFNSGTNPPSQIDSIESMSKPPIPTSEMLKLKKGEKLLTLADLNEYIQASNLDIRIQFVQSDVDSSTSISTGPWVYKNKKTTWIHYTISTNGIEESGKILLQNLFTRGFPKQSDNEKVSETPLKRKQKDIVSSPFKNMNSMI